MRIVVHYENSDEQALAERIVPDIEAVAKFAADVLAQPTTIKTYAAADFTASDFAGARGYTMEQIAAMRSSPNPIMGSVIPGGQSSQHGFSDLGKLGPGGITMRGAPGPPVYMGSHLTNAQLYGVVSSQDDPTKMTATIEPIIKTCAACGTDHAHNSCPTCLQRLLFGDDTQGDK